MTVDWYEPHSKWHNNDRTEGTYDCHASVTGAPSGSSVQVSPNSQTRTGTAQFTCDNGKWTLQSGSCDGALVNTKVDMVCSTTDVVLSGWVARYTNFLKRCADRDGLYWWASQDVETIGCTVYDTPPYKGYKSEQECWDHKAQDAAKLNGNSYKDAQYCQHISQWDEDYLCPPGTTYPWDATTSDDGKKCKYKQHDTVPCRAPPGY
jgi:hypothetical protein